MFVDISNPKDTLKVEMLLQPFDKYYSPHAKDITPDVAMNVLEATNNPLTIKKMLNCIASLPSHKQKEFQDVVLATFSNREQPNDILVLGKKLAVAGNYEKKLSHALKPQNGSYILSSLEPQKCIAWTEDSFEEFNYSKDDRVKVFAKYCNFSEQRDFPKCLDCSSCKSVYFCGADLQNVEQLILPSQGVANLSGASHLPPNIDFSKSSEVILEDCDLINQTHMQFKKGARADLLGAQNLPEDINVNDCVAIDLSYTDIAHLKYASFKEDAFVYLRGIDRFPQNFNVADCAVLDLSECDLKTLSQLDLGHKYDLRLKQVKNFPKKLDFSQVDFLHLREASFNGDEEIIFKHKKQARKSKADLSLLKTDKIHFAQQEPSQGDILAKLKGLFKSGGR